MNFQPTMMQIPQVQQPQQPQIIVVTVQGENGAQMYPVAAGNTVMLVDFDSRTFWLKTTAMNGLPQPMRKFQFEEITPQPQTDTNAVSRAEFDELKKMIATLAGGVHSESASISQ